LLIRKGKKEREAGLRLGRKTATRRSVLAEPDPGEEHLGAEKPGASELHPKSALGKWQAADRLRKGLLRGKRRIPRDHKDHLHTR
jgi:hypothetical protein